VAAVRVRGGGAGPAGARPGPERRAVAHGHRQLRFAVPASQGPVYRCGTLGPGARFDGPAIVEERETTAVIRPGWSVEVGTDGSLLATRGRIAP
jgi:N-methylhydantoinase A